MKNVLYPLKFEPILKERIWGGEKLYSELNKPLNGRKNIGESWELSGVEDDVSVVSNGFLQGNTLNELIEVYMGDLVGERVYKQYGNEFPLLIKFIDARDDLSIQVHPGDELAAKRHNSYGKTEMWYVLQAENGASLISGFARKVTPSEYEAAVEDNTIETLLAKHPVSAGDAFFIPAGRIHAIGAGILLAEIQQTSDLTYRIYDFDRRDDKGNARELHTGLALEAIDFSVYDNYKTDYKLKANTLSKLITSPFFSSAILELDKVVERDYYSLDSFVILICTEGAASIEFGEDNGRETIAKGDTVLIPAELQQLRFIPEPSAKIIEVHIP